MILEASPKWEVLSEILSEIQESTKVVDPGRGYFLKKIYYYYYYLVFTF